ncbi:hypothetical protein AB6A40_002070 [Gnathostoma spinigerum]|uniref:Uncharacterized protein n=1 Tax=Gnathostoma spinigerum TaxID=75299 RepID=A0ABD6E862_9BILA
MGNGASADGRGERPDTEKANSRQIDREIQREKASAMNVFKILLLGGSECGKTTIFKQMRVLHLNGFSNEDRDQYRRSIVHNAVDSLAQMLSACEMYRIIHEYVIQEKVKKFQTFYKSIVDNESDIVLTDDMVSTVQRIWQSSTLQLVYKRRFTYHLLDNAKYFLDSIDRIAAHDYSPTTQDIIHCRFQTTGIHELDFTYKKLEFKMVDVGGQRSERRKWIHCFDNVNMVLFVVAMSEFDQCDPEDSTQNRMMQSYQIFKTVVQSEYFKNASIVLFLNKFDIFQEKIKYTSLKKCWPDYNGDNSVEDCTKYLQKQFQRCVSQKQKYFAFVTTATDTNNIDLVFGSAVAHIVNQNLKATGLHE